MDNSTLDSIYKFYFEFEEATVAEKLKSQQLSNITFVGVILVLIFFILIFLWTIRRLRLHQGREITMDDAIMMNRIEGLRNEMNASELKTPDDPNSQYQMKNNRTPNNTSQEDPVYQDFGFVNPWV